MFRKNKISCLTIIFRTTMSFEWNLSVRCIFALEISRVAILQLKKGLNGLKIGVFNLLHRTFLKCACMDSNERVYQMVDMVTELRSALPGAWIMWLIYIIISSLSQVYGLHTTLVRAAVTSLIERLSSSETVCTKPLCTKLSTIWNPSESTSIRTVPFMFNISCHPFKTYQYFLHKCVVQTQTLFFINTSLVSLFVGG